MEKTNKGNDLIDLLKFAGSIMIFTMHCSAFSCFGKAGFVWEILSRWGVPFFFIGSAYFLFKKNPSGLQIKKYVKRIALLYGVWFIYNIPSIFAIRFLGKDFSQTSTVVNLLTNTFLSSTFTGSWYLLSCIFSAWAVFVLSKKLKTEIILLVTGAIQILCILTSVYCHVLPQSTADFFANVLQFPCNIFVGIFYFAVGKFIAEKEENLTKIPVPLCAVLTVVFYGLFIFENFVAVDKNVFGFSDQGIFLAPASFFIFVLCIKSNLKVKNAPTLRKLSTVIYCCQGNVLVVKEALGRYILADRIGDVSVFVSYLFALACVAVICVIVLLLQKKFKFVRYFT